MGEKGLQSSVTGGVQGRDVWGYRAGWTPSYLNQSNGEGAKQGPWALSPSEWLIALGQVHLVLLPYAFPRPKWK